MEHHFDVEIATEYGMLEAVLLYNLNYWITKNQANDKHNHDGYYWTYNSVRAYHELFPYASERRIRTALNHLEEEGIIITGNYNQYTYDRTTWYAITEKGNSILQNRQMEVTKSTNGSVENVEPIPDNNTDSNTDNKQIYIDIINYLNEKAGTHYLPDTKETRRCIDARLKDFTEDDFYTVIDKKVQEWKGTEFENFLRPQTLFGTKFESYLNQKTKSGNPFLDILRGTGS